MTEAALLREIRAALNGAKDSQGRYRCRVVRNSVGFDRERKVRYGLGLGSADLIGVIRGTGRVVAFEVKAGAAKPSTDQIAWLRALRTWGGSGAVVRSTAESMAALEAAERGEV